MNKEPDTLLRKNLYLLASFLVVYLLWGASYFAIKQALTSFPPVLLIGLRSLVAGLVLLGVVLLRGVKLPALRDWKEAGIVGILIIAMSGSLLSIGVQMVPTSIFQSRYEPEAGLSRCPLLLDLTGLKLEV
ncbi:MAG: EamA family transporter [Polaromonas sp.]